MPEKEDFEPAHPRYEFPLGKTQRYYLYSDDATTKSSKSQTEEEIQQKLTHLPGRLQDLVDDVALLRSAGFLDSESWERGWDDLTSIQSDQRYTNRSVTWQTELLPEPESEEHVRLGFSFGHLLRCLYSAQSPQERYVDLLWGFLLGILGRSGAEAAAERREIQSLLAGIDERSKRRYTNPPRDIAARQAYSERAYQLQTGTASEPSESRDRTQGTYATDEPTLEDESVDTSTTESEAGTAPTESSIDLESIKQEAAELLDSGTSDRSSAHPSASSGSLLLTAVDILSASLQSDPSISDIEQLLELRDKMGNSDENSPVKNGFSTVFPAFMETALERPDWPWSEPLHDEAMSSDSETSLDSILPGTCDREYLKRLEDLRSLVFDDADKIETTANDGRRAVDAFRAVWSSRKPKTSREVAASLEGANYTASYGKLLNDLAGVGTDSEHWESRPLLERRDDAFEITDYGALVGWYLFETYDFRSWMHSVVLDGDRRYRSELSSLNADSQFFQWRHTPDSATEMIEAGLEHLG